MNPLTTAFQASMYLLVVSSAAMLSHAEGAVAPEGLTIPLAVVAWIFVERWKLLRLPVWCANLLGVIAAGAATAELLSNDLEARLLAGAHFLIYLTWVVLFQRKTARQHWWLFSLSVLQVTVGSVLTQAGSYGMFLVLWFIGAIWTATLFTLWIAQSRIVGDRTDESSDPAGAAPKTASAIAAAPQATLAEVLRERSAVESTVFRDTGDRTLGIRFIFGTLGTSCAAILLAAAFFVLIPRVWIGSSVFASTSTAAAAHSLTGFSERVRLGDIGRIMESTENVMAVTVFDHNTNEPVDMDVLARLYGYDEPLFRGAVHTIYNQGNWTGHQGAGQMGSMPFAPPPGAPRFRQQISLKPIGSSILPAMHPASECWVAAVDSSRRSSGRNRDRHQARRFPFSGVIVLPDDQRNREAVDYHVFSPPPDQAELAPLPASVILQRQFLGGHMQQLPPRGLTRLVAEARRVARYQPGEAAPDNREMADRLVRWLRDSGEFQYSLDSSIRNSELDPIEDFLFERKQGHCEYYASALTLMLRAVGIPARMISGFKGGKVNRITRAFEVEQRHAHAWVEAFLDGRWVTFDATPAAARTESVEALEPDLPGIHDLMTFVRDFWSSYVVNLNLLQQRERLYMPLQQAAGAVWDALEDPAAGSPERGGALAAIRAFLASPREWFSLTGAIVAGALAGLAALMWRFRALGRSLFVRSRAAAGGADAARRRDVEFYERFRRLCAGLGFVRADAETHREFALSVQRRWPVLKAPDSSDAAMRLTEAFYRVRFGEAVLSPDEAAEVDRRLEILEARSSGR